MKHLLKTSLFLLALLACCTSTVLAQTQETVYLQTDRPSYVSGETLYFKLYILNAATHRVSPLSKVGYLELRAPKFAPVLKIRVSIAEGVAAGSFVLPDSLHSDVYQLVAFTAFMKNGGETPYFTRPILLANRLDKDLNIKTLAATDIPTAPDSLLLISTDKTQYGPNEKATLRLGSPFQKANLTVSVFEESQTIASGPSMVESLRAAAPAASIKQDYLPERPSKILRGRVLDVPTNQHVPNAIVLLSCADSVANLQYAVTNADGLFQLQLSPYYDNKELFLSTKEMPSGANWKIEVEDPFELPETWKPELRPVSISAKDFLRKSQNIASINKAYTPRREPFGVKPGVDKPFCPKLYHRPVKPILPADYVPLDSFPEIAVELLPNIRLTKQDGTYHARTVTREQMLYGRNEATFFLDGVYLDDLNKIMPLNSEKIKKIDVIEDKRAFGDVVFYGIVSIQTTSHEILKTVPGPHSLRLHNDTITGGNTLVEQRPPSNDQSRLPHFKQLLYWNPSATLQSDYTFHTTENTGTFLVRVEGITEDGKPLSATTRFQVNNPQTATEK